MSQEKTNYNYFLWVIAILALSLAFGTIIMLKQYVEANYLLQNLLSKTNSDLVKLNNTQTNIIKYITEKNEPFIKEVIKYANDTNKRIEKLENHK